MRVSVTFSSGSNSSSGRRRRRIQPWYIGWHWRDTGNTQPQNHEGKGTNKKGRKKYEGEERETHTHTTFMNIYFILPEANRTKAKKAHKFFSDVYPK
jgi:hypothetical protein